MPRSWYSIGSSTVTTFRVDGVQREQAGIERGGLAADPVGPVTSTMPFGSAERRREFRNHRRRQAQPLVVEIPRRCGRGCAAPPSRRCSEGMVETRKSTSWPRTASLMRPSCGSRRSAMSSRAMILMREVMAAASRGGGPRPPAARRRSGSARAAGPRRARYGCRRRGSPPRG